VCGQCHDEYYFAGDAKATTLPYTSLDTMNPDDILAYYDELGFVDFTNPDTGVGLIKVQHPEFETYLGEGSVMAALGYTCADCHMGTATADDGTEYANHNLTSPLDNEELIESTCSNCHADIVAEVAEIQEEAEARTNEIGYKLQDLTDQLAEAVANETIDDETYAAVAELNRDAQFYWDFVFVENSEGAHNSALTNDCLDKADDLVDQALELLAE
jgi:nitrite reductase (cytochrome c-552)